MGIDSRRGLLASRICLTSPGCAARRENGRYQLADGLVRFARGRGADAMETLGPLEHVDIRVPDATQLARAGGTAGRGGA